MWEHFAIHSIENIPKKAWKCLISPYSSNSDSDNNAEDRLAITKILNDLVKKFPALYYLQYSDAFDEKDIYYTISAIRFSYPFHVNNIRMSLKAVYSFLLRV